MHDTEADPGERPGGPGAPLCLDQTEGRKNVFENGHPPPPYLRVWMTGSPLLWRSGSATMVNAILGSPGADSRVGRKGGASLFKHGSKSPWVPTLTELFPKIQANCGSWLGTKNALYYCAQSGKFFSWVRTRRLLSRHTCPVRSASLRVQGKLLFSTFLTSNEGTTDGSKKHLDAISRSNSIPPENILFLTDHNVLLIIGNLRCSSDEKVK